MISKYHGIGIGMQFSFHHQKRIVRRAAAVILLSVALVCSAGVLTPAARVQAATSAELKKKRNQTQSQLNSARNKASSLKNEQDSVSEELAQKTKEIAENMTAISMMQDQISDLEDQIKVKQQEYEAAEADEQQQYESMKKRIQFMYEKGNTSYVQLLLQASSLGDALNKAEYVERLYDYDRKMLKKYEQTVQQVADAKKALEDEKSELETTQAELKENETELESQQSELQAKYDNYDELIAEAQSEAALLKQQVQQENAQISTAEAQEAAAAAAKRQAEAEAALRAQQEAAAAAASSSSAESSASAGSSDAAGTGTSTDGGQTDTGIQTETSSSGSSSSESSSASSQTSTKSYAAAGSASGSNVVSYAEQFVGNPYVYGGTSLTNGADCSGFTQSVYKAFGYSLPRTSYEQMNAGTEVSSLAEAQPGDLICYGGHVAIYIGNGQIVHASTPATGIKYGYAAYRSILTIRRIIN